MTFTLKPDDNGIVVVLSNVDEKDIDKLEAANKKGFDPTEEPFAKYYDYSKYLGFFVNKDHFDHAEHKGKRLSYDDYMKQVSEMTTSASDCIHFIDDAKYDVPFVVARILEIKEPKTVREANAALATLNFALFNLADNVAEAEEDKRADFHKAIDHAQKIQAKAEAILSASDFAGLLDLSDQLSKYRKASALAQSTLLQKFNENF